MLFNIQTQYPSKPDLNQSIQTILPDARVRQKLFNEGQ